MKTCIKKSIALSLIMVLLTAMIIPGMPVSFAATSGQTQLVDLTVNYKSNPLGIETDNLRFSWKMDSNIIGQGQSDYQIVVREAAANGPVAWDSGIVDSGLSVAVPFGGNPSIFKLETRYYWTVTVTDAFGDQHVAAAYFETGADWAGVDWITIPNYASSMESLAFRTERALTGSGVKSARLYITAAGAYEAYINGKLVQGEKRAVMAPGWTDALAYINYQTYDVTDYITGGNVTLASLNTTGWYGGSIGGSSSYSAAFRNADNQTTSNRERCLLAKLVIEYTNGNKQVISTSAGNAWQVSSSTPLAGNNVGLLGNSRYSGAIAKAMAGWNDNGYNAASWTAPVAMLYQGKLFASSTSVPYEYQTQDLVEAYKYRPAVLTSGVWDNGDIIWGNNPYYNYSQNNAQPSGSSSYRTGEIDPAKIVHYQPGQPMTINTGEALVLDFGQNAAAVPNLILSGPAGAIVTLQPGENVSDGNSTVTTDTAGWTPSGAGIPRGAVNYQGGAANGKYFTYILSGDGQEQYYAPYLFIGHRYLSVSTNDGPVTIYSAKSVAVTSEMYEATTFESSNPLISQFISNSKWSQISNFVSVPTDCPTREFNGWTGDAEVFAETGLYHFDAVIPIGNYIQIMNEGHKRLGRYNSTMPNGTGTTESPGWTDAGVIIPWEFYQQTGDISLVAECWDEMCKYVDAMNAKGNYAYPDAAFRANDPAGQSWVSPYTTTSNNGTAWGDHLGVYMPTGQFTTTMFHLYDIQLMVKMAEALGKTADVAKYSAAAAIVTNYMETRYLQPDGNVRSGRSDDAQGSSGYAWAPYFKVDNAQTALAWMLKLGFGNEQQREVIAANLAKSIANEGSLVNPRLGENSISAGFLGVHVLLPEMSKNGQSETAYALMNNTERNSFLYAVAPKPNFVPATTIWEEWVIWGDAPTEGWGKGSQNHYSYGASSAWLYKYTLGIEKDEGAPGFKHIILQPTPDSSLDYAKGSYESYYGNIASGWSNANGKLSAYNCVVPANTTATLYLPVASIDSLKTVYGAEYQGMATHNGVTVAEFALLSGGYDFTVENGNVVVAYADQYIGPVLAEIRADEASVGINTPASYTVSLTYAEGAGVVTLSFIADGRYLDLYDATALNGFSILDPLSWEYVGSQLWKGTVKLYYPGLVNVDGPLDVLRVSGVARDLLGDTTVTLTEITVTGDVNGFSGDMPSVIVTAGAETSIVSKTVFSKYDLNHDGRIDELDLAIVVYYYLENDLEADWDVVKFDIASAKDCDVAVNGRVDLADMIEVIANYCDSY